jgi:hypothetical protein
LCDVNNRRRTTSPSQQPASVRDLVHTPHHNVLIDGYVGDRRPAKLVE